MCIETMFRYKMFPWVPVWNDIGSDFPFWLTGDGQTRLCEDARQPRETNKSMMELFELEQEWIFSSWKQTMEQSIEPF